MIYRCSLAALCRRHARVENECNGPRVLEVVTAIGALALLPILSFVPGAATLRQRAEERESSFSEIIVSAHVTVGALLGKVQDLLNHAARSR